MPVSAERMTHDMYLDNLVSHLMDIGENLRSVRWIMKDGLWLIDGQRQKLCDLIISYSTYAVPVELKGSNQKHKRQKAMEQISRGYDFISTELHLVCRYGKFVIYNDGAYVTTRVELPRVSLS
jgi:hypothetical protein